jgi:hypothetical protein
MSTDCDVDQIHLWADQEAEKCVLGALLTGKAAILELASEVDAQLFFFQTSRTVFEAIASLHCSGVPIDVVVLTQYLSRTGKLESVGGAFEITQLATLYDKPVAVARYELSVLRELHAKRRLRELGSFLAKAAPQTDLTQLFCNADEAIAEARAIHGPPVGHAAFIEFRTPLELKAFAAPEDAVLVGDNHIVRGTPFVIGGPPGVGKSRASVALAVAGATGQTWFGLTVHRRFKTLIVQNENGPLRLSTEFRDLDCERLDGWVKVSPPPPFGLCFDRAEFRAAIANEIESFKPDVIIIDPWNAAARDERARDYLETFNWLRDATSRGADAPALGIVAHTRKPKSDEKATGRGQLNLLAGSYVLGSIPRSVFVMQAATDNPEDQRVIVTCCKNNDGQLGPRTAWIRCNGLFIRVEDFDWSSFEAGQSNPKEPAVTAEDMEEIFVAGPISRADAVCRLEQKTKAGRTTCYNALKRNGKFAEHLLEENGTLRWVE